MSPVSAACGGVAEQSVTQPAAADRLIGPRLPTVPGLARLQLDTAALARSARSGGVFPIVTNDQALAAVEPLRAYKRRPRVEKRFSQFKTDFEVAPVPPYPEGRPCKTPTTRRMLDVFEGVPRHELRTETDTQVVVTVLTELQRDLLQHDGLSPDQYGHRG